MGAESPPLISSQHRKILKGISKTLNVSIAMVTRSPVLRQSTHGVMDVAAEVA